MRWSTRIFTHTHKLNLRAHQSEPQANHPNIDDDNDGILDVEEKAILVDAVLDQVGPLPPSAFVAGGGVVPDGVPGVRLSGISGSYYQGPNTSSTASSNINSSTGQINGSGIDGTEGVELAYTLKTLLSSGV